jgi:hypothetical protein
MPEMPDEPDDFGGTVLLVAVNRTCASLWRVRADGDRGLASVAARAWRDASVALGRSIPVWPPRARDAHRNLPRFGSAHRLLPRPGWAAEAYGDLEGTSFGLAFLMIQAARVLEQPPDPTIAALAAVDPSGNLQPVEELALKADALREFGGAHRRLIVAQTQKDGVDEAEELGFEIDRHATASSALRQAFPRFSEALANTRDPAELESLVRALFHFAVGHRQALVDWTPVSATAEVLTTLPEIHALPTAPERVAYAYAFSRRRQGHHGPCELPGEPLLARLWRAERWKLCAQLLQHAADTGTPDPQGVLALAAAEFPQSEMDWLEQHVEMAGARARLWSILGRHEEAFEDQMKQARILLALDRPASATYQLAEGFRLAGAMGCWAKFQRVEALLAQAEDMVDLRATDGMIYVDVAMARALWMLGEHQRAVDIVMPLHERHELPEHVVVIALRVLIGALEALRDELGARRERAELDDHTARRDGFGDDAQRALALVRIDDALRAREPVDVDGFAAAFGLHEPLAQLRRARPRDLWPDEADYIARFYPY